MSAPQRLWALLRTDLRLQVRQGFYSAYLVVSIVYIVALRLVPGDIRQLALPLILLSDPALLGFYFIGGLVMLEREDRTLDALFATPVHTREYVGAKALSLTFLSLLACLVIAWASGAPVRIVPLLLGVLLTAPLFVFIGIVAASRTSSVNQYLFTSILYVVPIVIPLIEYFGVAASHAWMLLPMGAALRFFAGALEPVPGWVLACSAASLLVWNAFMYHWARRWFDRYTIGRIEANPVDNTLLEEGAA